MLLTEGLFKGLQDFGVITFAS